MQDKSISGDGNPLLVRVLEMLRKLYLAEGREYEKNRIKDAISVIENSLRGRRTLSSGEFYRIVEDLLKAFGVW